MVNTLQVHQEYDFSSFFSYYSSWMRLKKGMAWILRLRKLLLDLSKERKKLLMVYSDMDKLHQETVIEKEMQTFRSHVHSNLLSSDELEKAELEIIRLCQRKRYLED